LIYLDHAASTPLDPQVAESMAAVMRDPALQANPSSSHAPGRAARACIEAARSAVATLAGATPAGVVFTSGATEANNLGIIGTARFRAVRGRHLVTSAAEHASVREACRCLEREGWAVTWLECGRDGLVDPAAVAAAIRPDTTLVSLMAVNNETGVVQDIEALGALCRQRDVPLHVDAVQAAGREPIDMRREQVDLLSLSAHKFGGPRGVGALVLDTDRVARIQPLYHGGAQERGLRPGTLPTHQLHGMGVAAAIASARLPLDPPRIAALRTRLEERLLAVSGVRLNGHATRRACHIANVTVAGVEGESLQLALEEIAVSAGSACDSGNDDPSPVLMLLGLDREAARSSVRFSLGVSTTAEEIDRAAAVFEHAVSHLRRLAPAA